MPDAEIVLWGLPAPESLRERLARYLSPPLTPLHLHELPSRLSFRACPTGEWEIGPRASKQPVIHPGPTLGYRISEGDASLCYIPDQELALGPRTPGTRAAVAPRFRPRVRRLAPRPRLPVHGRGVLEPRRLGHSRLGDVLAFARLTEAQRLLLFHHDPLHDDEQLDRLHAEALARWGAAGRSPHEVLMAAELQELELDHVGTGVAAAAHAHRP